MKPSLIIHGGAWNIPDEAVPDCRTGIRRALEAGWKVLSGSGSAIDAVEAAIIVLEDDPTFDAGFGSHLNRDGHVQLDAILMDGKTLKGRRGRRRGTHKKSDSPGASGSRKK